MKNFVTACQQFGQSIFQMLHDFSPIIRPSLGQDELVRIRKIRRGELHYPRSHVHIQPPDLGNILVFFLFGASCKEYTRNGTV